MISGAEPKEVVRSKPIPIQSKPSSNYNNLNLELDYQMQQEMSKPWDPLKSIFSTATKFSNCKFHITVNSGDRPQTYKETSKFKRRRVMIDSDNDDE